MKPEIMGRWSPELKCHVHRIEYNFDSCTGLLYLPDGHCCDMVGAINLFERLDAKVKTIQSFSGPIKDTCYVKQREGWKAHEWRRVAAVCDRGRSSIDNR